MPAKSLGLALAPAVGRLAALFYFEVHVPLQALVSSLGAIFLPMGHSLRRYLLLVLVGVGIWH